MTSLYTIIVNDFPCAADVWVCTHGAQVGQDAGEGRRRLDTHEVECGRGLCLSADEGQCPPDQLPILDQSGVGIPADLGGSQFRLNSF